MGVEAVAMEEVGVKKITDYKFHNVFKCCTFSLIIPGFVFHFTRRWGRGLRATGELST